MTRVVLRVKATRAQARAAIRQLPAALSGRAPSPEARSLSILLGMTLLSQVKEAFLEKARGGTDEAGERWAPLTGATLARRRKGPGSGTPEILRDTGLLLNSLSPGPPTPGTVTVGTNHPAARYHHEGTPRMSQRRLWPPPARWPARWWLELGQATRDGLVRMLRRALGGQ